MEHKYTISNRWTGNSGSGTQGYRTYERSYRIEVDGKQELNLSADAHFRGDKSKYNPEELLLIALSACHMLSYLHACAEAGIVVLDYVDRSVGTMITTDGGRKGSFSEVMLFPVVTVKDASMISMANDLHKKANEMCFIANSCNFPVRHEAQAILSM